MKTILFIPGFACDTFSTIENYDIEMTKILSEKYNIIWLVPSIKNPYNIFKYEINKNTLKEPIYVTEAQKHNIKMVVANLSRFNIFKNLFVLQKIFKEHNVDAVYLEFGYERYIGAIFSKILGKKTIFRGQGHLGTSYKHLKKFVHTFFIDYFLPVSYYVESFIPKSKKSFVIHNTVEVIDYLRNSNEISSLKQELCLDSFEFIVIMISAFREVKKHDVAIDIIEKIKNKTDKNIGFVFLGYEELYDYYKNQIKTRKLEDFIIMPGHTKDVAKYLKIADVSMLTSLEEGFPVSFLESMNYKLPLIAFNTGWARELIFNGINGYLINIDDKEQYANAIIELAFNQEKKQKFGENSYKILNYNYGMHIWREKIKKAFDEIMK